MLKKNNRLDKNDPEAVQFNNFLNSLYYSENTENDWNLLCYKCSYFSIGNDEQTRRGFEKNDAVYLYTNNKEVQIHNNRKIMNIG